MKKTIVAVAVLLGSVAASASAQVPGSLGDAEFLAYAQDLAPIEPITPAPAQSFFDEVPAIIGADTGDDAPLRQDDIVARAVVTPEPASIVLLATGLAGVATFSRRRRKS